MDWGLKFRIARDAAAGLAFMHHEGIVHRDIAARNILLGETYQAYIADLGMSRLFENPSDSEAGQQTKSTVGPVRWMAPEALMERRYSTATDAYSFGILLWEISSDGKLPYGDMSTVAEAATAVLRQNARPAVLPSTPLEFSQLMTQLWRKDPSERPSMSEAFETLKILCSL